MHFRRTFIKNLVGTAGATLSGAILPSSTASSFEEPKRPDEESGARLTLAFASCCDQKFPQTFWNNVAKGTYDFWIWLGDIIYADRSEIEERRAAFTSLKNQPGYKKLRSKSQVLGTWDDHDYAYNDAGMEYEGKDESKLALLDFLDEPTSSERRKRPGVYTARRVSLNGLSVLIVLLDLRTFKERQVSEHSLLGVDQWNWLQDVLFESKDTDDLVIIGSSVQCLPDFTTKECWYKQQPSRTRLLDLINSIELPTVILSGDRHFVEISEMKQQNGLKLIEFTSSGLTHTSDKKNNNSYRVGKVIQKKNFSKLEISSTDDSITVAFKALTPESSKVLVEYSHTFERKN